jgi:SAM-dependent methyltransferase
MDDPIAERVRRYILDGSNEDLRRLLSISQVTADPARAAFGRVGVQEGWRVLDCGCGPIGALAVMAEFVGSDGQVLGIDFNGPSIERARSVIAELGLTNVKVAVGDVNAPDIELAVRGGFHLAFTRCFLTHQTQPAHTLTQIAARVRSGGWIVAHEPLRSPPPRSHPDLDALGASWKLLHEVMESAGAQHLAVDGLAGCARAAGLEVVSESGFFVPMPPALGFEIHASTLAAAKERAVQSGVAAERDIDQLVGELRAAKQAGYEWVSSPFFLDLAVRKPISTEASVSELAPS